MTISMKTAIDLHLERCHVISFQISSLYMQIQMYHFCSGADLHTEWVKGFDRLKKKKDLHCYIVLNKVKRKFKFDVFIYEEFIKSHLCIYYLKIHIIYIMEKIKSNTILLPKSLFCCYKVKVHSVRIKTNRYLICCDPPLKTDVNKWTHSRYLISSVISQWLIS